MDDFLQEGDKIQCKDARDLRYWALNLSAQGYGVAVIGYHDIYEHILTITALPVDGSNMKARRQAVNGK